MPVRAVAYQAAEDSRDAIRPPLKRAGGKRWQLPHLGPIWRQYQNRRLAEPFCGGLAVTVGLMPRRALLNDINQHLINFYDWLKRGLRITLTMENDAAKYYEARVRFNELLSSGKSHTSEAAVLFYYLNRTGYNGLCRFNHFVGYSIQHVSGRFRSGALRTQDEAATLQKRGERYLIDETTAVTRFIFPYKTDQELAEIKHLLEMLIIRSIIQLVNGEEQIWMVESGSAGNIWERLMEDAGEEEVE